MIVVVERVDDVVGEVLADGWIGIDVVDCSQFDRFDQLRSFVKDKFKTEFFESSVQSLHLFAGRHVVEIYAPEVDFHSFDSDAFQQLPYNHYAALANHSFDEDNH